MKLSHVRGLVLNSSTLFGSTLAAAALNFAQSVIVTRAFGPARYGVWATITSSAVLVQAFMGFRTTEALTRALIEPLSESGVRRQAHLFSAALFAEIVTRLIALGIIFAISPMLAANFGGGSENWYLYAVFAFTQLLGVLDAPLYSALRVGRKFFIMAAFPIFTAGLTLIGTAALKFATGTVTLEQMVWIYLAAYGIRFLVSAFYFSREVTGLYGLALAELLPWRWFAARHELLEFWRYMRFSFLSSSMTSVMKNIDVFILGYLTSTTEVGLYRLAKNLWALVQQFANSLSTVEFQDLADYVAKNADAIPWERIKRITAIFAPACFVLGVIGTIAAGPAIRLCFGPAYVPSTASFIVLLWSAMITTTLFWAQPLTLVLRLYRMNLWNVAITGAASIAAIFIFAPEFGALGASIGSAIGWATASLGCIVSIVLFNNRKKPRTDAP